MDNFILDNKYFDNYKHDESLGCIKSSILLKDLDEDKSGPKNVTNNSMFVGSTADLQKMLKKQKEINNTDTK